MPVRTSVNFQTSAATKLITALLDIKNPNKFPTRDVWRDSIPKCPPLDSTSLLQYENEPQRKIRQTLNVSAYHDQILSDEWDIDFLKTTMNIKPNARNKGFSLDEIKATNFELLETLLVIVLDTADDYVKILGVLHICASYMYNNLGWTLNDKSAGVRKASILALQDVYDVDENVPFLRPFTLRFYKRMLDLADDNDISVAVCAISLVKQLLRRAIGALVYDHVIAQKFRSLQPRSSGDEGDRARIHLLKIRQILREFSTDQVLSLYLIDDIWEFMDAMQKAVGERIVPAIDHRKPNHTKAQKEMIESSKKNITVCMIKNYPQLMRKYMADKAKVPSLVEIIVHMDLELYSLKSQDQKFKAVLQLMKETFFKHGDKDALRSCVRAINYCSSGSRGELKDYAQNKLKEVEDELVVKVKSAIREVANGDDEYLLLVNMKRLYELQLTRHVQIEDLYADIIAVVGFLLLNMYLHVTWCLHSIMNSSKAVSEESLSSLITSLITKRNELYEQLDYFLQILLEAQGKGTSRNLLACRVSILTNMFEL
ncbi:sister-chromatid cohesion protein 3 [Tanacetum coccineum]